MRQRMRQGRLHDTTGGYVKVKERAPHWQRGSRVHRVSPELRLQRGERRQRRRPRGHLRRQRCGGSADGSRGGGGDGGAAHAIQRR